MKKSTEKQNSLRSDADIYSVSIPPRARMCHSLLIPSRPQAIPPVPFCQITLKAQKPPDPVYPKLTEGLGGHIRKRRLEEKMTAQELGNRLGIDQDTVYKWEYNRFSPATRHLGRFDAGSGMSAGHQGRCLKRYPPYLTAASFGDEMFGT